MVAIEWRRCEALRAPSVTGGIRSQARRPGGMMTPVIELTAFRAPVAAAASGRRQQAERRPAAIVSPPS
jgi:hypothetical protein